MQVAHATRCLVQDKAALCPRASVVLLSPARWGLGPQREKLLGAPIALWYASSEVLLRRHQPHVCYAGSLVACVGVSR